MKKPVHDDLVAEYVKRLRSGGPVGQVFAYPLNECDFTRAQKKLIGEAHAARQKILNKLNPKPATASLPQAKGTPKTAVPKTDAPKLVTPKSVATLPKSAAPKPPAPAPAPKPKTLKKLEKMLYLQGGKCFFCGEKLGLADANIEHLHSLSKGGKREADNEVVCHKTLNETFGNLPLKQKFEFVLKAAGSFRCPKK